MTAGMEGMNKRHATGFPCGICRGVAVVDLDGGYLCARHTIEEITIDLRAEEPIVISTGGRDVADGADGVPFIRGVLVAGVVLLVPFFSSNVIDAKLAILPTLVIPMMAIVVLWAVSKIGPSIRGRPRNPATWLALSIPVLMTVAALFHSVQDSLYPLFLALGASALALVIWDMSRDDTRRYVVYPLLTAASIQAVVAIIQLATTDAVVPEWLATGVAPNVIDGVLRAPGTMGHAYLLAALGLLAIGGWTAIRESHQRTPYPVMIGLGMSTALVTIAFSRSALVGLTAAAIAVAVGAVRGDQSVHTVVSILVGVGVLTMLVTASSWSARVDHSTASDLDDATLGRVTLMRQAATLMKAEPTVGVGPGQYLSAIEARGLLNDSYPYIVHTYSLAFAAENGVPAGLIVTGLLVWLGAAAIRAGPGVGAAYVAVLPLLLFDHMHYDVAAGQLMLGIWLGVLAAALRWRSADRSVRAATNQSIGRS